MLALRQIASNASKMLPACRWKSTLPLVDVADHDGIAVMTMQRPPVNSLNLDLLQAINISLDEVSNNKPRGLILTSAYPSVFCAGLDLKEIYKPEKNRLELLANTLYDTWVKLFGFEFATAAAINGHARAGGCLFAISCDWRAIVDGKGIIGLNEAALGLVVPMWVIDTMCHVMSPRNAELALTTCKLFTPDEALKVGLIDEIVVDKSDAVEKCKKFIERFDQISPLARSVVKQRIRQKPLRKLRENRQQEIDYFLRNMTDTKVQKELEVYINRIKSNKTKNI